VLIAGGGGKTKGNSESAIYQGPNLGRRKFLADGKREEKKTDETGHCKSAEKTALVSCHGGEKKRFPTSGVRREPRGIHLCAYYDRKKKKPLHLSLSASKGERRGLREPPEAPGEKPRLQGRSLKRSRSDRRNFLRKRGTCRQGGGGREDSK